MWHFSTTQFRQKHELKTILPVPPVALSYLRPPFCPYKELMKRSQSTLSPGERPNRMWVLAAFHPVSDKKRPEAENLTVLARSLFFTIKHFWLIFQGKKKTKRNLKKMEQEVHIKLDYLETALISIKP